MQQDGPLPSTVRLPVATKPVEPVGFSIATVDGKRVEMRLFERNPLPACRGCQACNLTQLQNGQFSCIQPANASVVSLPLLLGG
jgi:hypothetical protein